MVSNNLSVFSPPVYLFIVRKMMSTVATRKPGRRGARSDVSFFPVRRSTPLTQKVKAGPLMKQTMKMAQQRYMFVCLHYFEFIFSICM